MLRWDKFKVVTYMQQYIEDNLNNEITLKMLTTGTGYSMYYAQRMFTEVTGVTPFEYLRRRRLSEASKKLLNSNIRIIDVAFEFVFDSHEGFTRAFSREFGLTPSEFIKSRPALECFMPDFMRDYYSNRQKGTKKMKEQKLAPVFIQIIERPLRKMILKRGKKAEHYFAYCEEVGCDVWDVLSSIPEALMEPMGLWLEGSLRPEGTSKYVQGVEVPLDWSGEIPNDFEAINLEACSYMVFQGPEFSDENFEQAIEDIWDVMAGYKPEIQGYEWNDLSAPRFQLQPMGYRGYIEGRGVKKIGTRKNPF